MATYSGRIIKRAMHGKLPNIHDSSAKKKVTVSEMARAICSLLAVKPHIFFVQAWCSFILIMIHYQQRNAPGVFLIYFTRMLLGWLYLYVTSNC
jgi:hypothetical protein